MLSIWHWGRRNEWTPGGSWLDNRFYMSINIKPHDTSWSRPTRACMPATPETYFVADVLRKKVKFVNFTVKKTIWLGSMSGWLHVVYVQFVLTICACFMRLGRGHSRTCPACPLDPPLSCANIKSIHHTILYCIDSLSTIVNAQISWEGMPLHLLRLWKRVVLHLRWLPSWMFQRLL